MAKKKTSDIIDVRALVQSYLSKWYLFVLSVVLCCILGYVVVKVKQPVYGVRSSIYIKDDEANPMAGLSSMADIFGSNGSVDNDVFMISSHSVYRDVVKQLQIHKLHYVHEGFLRDVFYYPEFPIDVTAAPAIADTLTKTIKFFYNIDKNGRADVTVKQHRDVLADVEGVKLPYTFKTEYGQFTLAPTATYVAGESLSGEVDFEGYDAMAESLAEMVGAGVSTKKSNVIQLKINVENTDFGCDILNSLMAAYNERNINDKNAQGEKTLQFIDERLVLIADDLNSSEVAIARYKEKNKMVDLEVEATYQTTKRAQIDKDLMAAETQAGILKMTLDFLNVPDNAYSLIPATIDNKALESAIGQYNELVLERMKLATSAKANNVALKQIEASIDAMRSNILLSVDRAYKSSLVTVSDLRRELGTTQGRLGQVPAQELQFIDMKRQQEVKQELYVFLLQRREETAMLIANAVPKGQIIDAAYTLNKPLSMGKSSIMIIAFLFGLMLPPIGLYLRRMLRNKFDTREEVERIVSVPVLGEICTEKSGRQLVVSSTDTTSISELFRLMRSALLFVLSESTDKVVLMTSTVSGEGKSFVSINLASSLALLEGKKVCLVGMDIRKPRLSQYLKVSAPLGLTQYLASSEVSIDNIITHNPLGNGLDLIVAGPVPPNPGELLMSKKVEALFEELRLRYDYIIVDTAPVGMVSDTFTLDRIADATVYVTRANYTSINDLRYIDEIYEDHRLKKLSIVINGTATKKGYGYGYGEGQHHHRKS